MKLVKKITAIFMVVLLTLNITLVTVFAEDADQFANTWLADGVRAESFADGHTFGDGTGQSANNPYLISSAAELAYLSYSIIKNEEDSSDCYCKLTNDITNLGDHMWVPIAYFYGTFEGAGNTINGLTCDETVMSDGGVGGLFGALFGAVQNLSLTNVDISSISYTGDFAVGAVTPFNLGRVINCRTDGKINITAEGNSYIGGLVGLNYGFIYSSYSQCKVSITSIPHDNNSYSMSVAGGLVGANEYQIDEESGKKTGLIVNSFSAATTTDNTKVAEGETAPNLIGTLCGIWGGDGPVSDSLSCCYYVSDNNNTHPINVYNEDADDYVSVDPISNSMSELTATDANKSAFFTNASNWVATTAFTNYLSTVAYSDGKNTVSPIAWDAKYWHQPTSGQTGYPYPQLKNPTDLPSSTPPTTPTMKKSDKTVTISGSEDADSDLDHYEYKIGEDGKWISGNSINMSDLSPGATTLYSRAVDKAGNISDEASLEVTIANPASIDSYDGSTTYETTNTNGVAVDSSLTLSMGDNLSVAHAYITNGFVSGKDTLSFTNTEKITGSYDKAKGVLTLTGTDTSANYQTALRSVKFTSTSLSTEERTIIFTLGSALYNPDNGHFYEYINNSNDITWTDAKAAAAAKSFYGSQGYLVTITNSAENDFLRDKLGANAWIGASDSATESTWKWDVGAPAAEAGQTFYTGKSPSGTTVNGCYSNWNSGEPNNSGDEDYAMMYSTEGRNGKWNDYPNDGDGVTGYVVEYNSANGAADLKTVHTVIPNNIPVFTNNTTALIVDANSQDNDIRALLHVSDSDSGQTLTWTQKTAPSHGTLSFTNSSTGSGSADIEPGGSISYTPANNYTGPDSFTVQVSDGTAVAMRTITVTVIDRIAPTGTITQGTNNWNSFLNTVTFGLFFKQTANITITAADDGGSGVKSIQYYKSPTALTEPQVQELTDWRNYSSALSLNPTDAEKFIIYAKITDNAGNVTVISSNGMQFDLQAPSISTNYTKDATSMEVTVTDSGSGVGTVTYTVNGGSPQTAMLSGSKFTISSLANGKYDVVITAKDTIENTGSLTVHVVSLHTVVFKLFSGDTDSALKTETVEYGNAATAPSDPSRTGFTFKGWDKAYSNITTDTTVNATWNISGITVTPYTATYDSFAHNAVTVTGTLSGDVITYSTNGTDFASALPQYTNAGNYPIYVKVERTGYTAWESGLTTAVINRTAGSVNIISDPGKVYDGTAVSNPAFSQNSTGAVTFTYYKDNAGVISTQLSVAPSAAGIYWVKTTLTQDTNYTASEAIRKFTISRAPIAGSVSIPASVLTGDTVSANVSGVLPVGTTYTYQWKLNGVDISGATSSGYLVKPADYGKKLTVTLTATDNYTGSITSAAAGIGETVKPTGTITQGSNSWNSFLNTISFGLFFKQTANITITGADEGGSGVKSIQYYKSASALTEPQVQALTDWSNYTSALSLTPTDAEKFIIYAKITDNAGNVTVISSNGMQFDLQAPSISTNYTKDATSMEVTVTDSGSGVGTVTYTVNGGSTKTVALSGGKFTISSLADGKYDVVITAKDTVENTGSLTVHVVSLHTVVFKLFSGDTGSALKTETVEYGNAATAPSDPSRTGFTFRGWDNTFDSITADTTVNATWDISGITVTPYAASFDGLAHDAVSIAGTLPGDVITYSTNGTDFISTLPQYTNASSYPVYVKVARTGYTTWESGLTTAVINQKKITNDMITAIPSVQVTSQPFFPLPQVQFGSITLVKDTDYTVTYSDNTDIGLATVTITGTGNYSDTATKQFAIYAKNTGITIGNNQTPQAIVKGLDKLYEDETVYTEEDRQIEQNGGSVRIELSVQAKTNFKEDTEKIESLAPDKIIGLYLDLSIYKTVTLVGEENGNTTKISHLNDLLTIIIPVPENIKGQKGIALYRVHDGKAVIIPIGKENAVDGEYCTIDGDNITLYVRNFSTYAIGYNKAKDGSGNSTSPDTGDHTNAIPFIVLVINSLVMIVVLRRKNRMN